MNFGVFDFLGAFGSPVEAIAYAKLFWPDCVEVDGMVLRSDVVEDEMDVLRLREVLQKWNGDISKTECSFNLIEIPCGVFGKRSGESSDALDEQLARILAEMWHARLIQKYPNRIFSVILEHDNDGTVFVTFCQVK
jgi:hypothetical protein